MALTKENMKTDPTGERWNLGTLIEDITRMDDGQLTKYVRMAFTGQSDEDFLPSVFWDRHFYINSQGDPQDPPQPGTLFGDIYEDITNLLEGKTKREYQIDLDLEYRPRLEKVLKGIMGECLAEGAATQEKEMLAFFSVQAVYTILYRRGFVHPDAFEKFSKFFEEGISPDTTKKLRQKTKFPDYDSNELFGLARKLELDPRYAHINFVHYARFRPLRKS